MHRHAVLRSSNSIAVLTMAGLFVVLTAVCLTSKTFRPTTGRKLDSKQIEAKKRVTRSVPTNKPNTTKSSRDSSNKDEYPDDIFSLEDKEHGAVVLHVFGLAYMFLALATVSDEFFIPTLEVITEEFSVSEDVAGATFMAAGGSAPELFTSLIGVFVANSNVGFGTIVGSAVFNVLFVIGMCAVFSKGVLQLTWWPLFRDCLFYILALTLLIVFFINERTATKSSITWWESCTLMSCYFLYVLFMKYNVQIERWVKGVVSPQNRVADESFVLTSKASRRDTDAYVQKALEYLKGKSKEGQCFRFGLLQLVLRTIDPLRDASICELVKEMESIADNNRRKSSTITCRISSTTSSRISLCPVGHASDTTLPLHSNFTTPSRTSSGNHTKLQTVPVMSTSINKTTVEGEENYLQISEPKNTMEGQLENKSDCISPLDLSWPKSFNKRIVYVIRAPILFLLHFTLSDVRKPEKRKRYPWTFFVSILWIVIFSYFMVWWAKEISITIGIEDEIMGLTVLAAGTSIPDLITSVLVARKGYGDMAVSSSVGSNLFDVTIGLPLPWLIWSIINSGRSFEVTSSGLFCSTIMLFFMLLAVVISIAVSKWKMSKGLGISMLLLYIVFLVLSVLLQQKVMNCDF